MYKSMIIGTETNTELINKLSKIVTRHNPRKMNRISFPFHAKVLNFKAIISNLTTSISAPMADIPASRTGSNISNQNEDMVVSFDI